MILKGKCFSSYILLTDQISFPDCLSLSRYLGYVHYNCLFTRLWRQEFWNWPYLSNQVLSLHDQKVKRRIEIIWKRRGLLGWNKKYFHHFCRAFHCEKLCQTWECAFNVLHFSLWMGFLKFKTQKLPGSMLLIKSCNSRRYIIWKKLVGPTKL